MPKIVDHDAYRKELLGKCFALFSRKGYSNVTMRGIAEEIGVSTGTLYHYFPTKVSILEQMFTWAVEDVEAYSRSAATGPSLPERLTRLSEFWVRSMPRYQNLLLLALDLFRHSPRGSERVLQDYVDHYRSAISRALGMNGRVSRVLVTYVLGMVVQSLLLPHQFAAEMPATVVRDAVASLLAVADGARRGRSEKPRAVAARQGRR